MVLCEPSRQGVRHLRALTTRKTRLGLSSFGGFRAASVDETGVVWPNAIRATGGQTRRAAGFPLLSPEVKGRWLAPRVYPVADYPSLS